MVASPALSNVLANSKGAAVTAFLLILLFAALPFSVPATSASSASSPVQAWIDSAKPGDTIHIPAGHYYGQVNINKTVKLVGENSSSTILDGSNVGDVVSVTANNVEICGLTIQNSGPRGIGLNVEYCKGGYIHDNVMKDNYEGLAVGGCSNIFVSANQIMLNFGNLGAMINYSTLVTFSRNIVTKNHGGGLVVYHCSNCTVSENQLVENDDKSVVWSVGMVLSNSYGVIVSGNNITGNAYHGLNLVSCHDDKVTENFISKNVNGVCISGGTNNDVNRNVVKSNENGLAFYGSSNNRIFHNDILNNTRQVYSFFPTERNTFDNGYPSGGNFWSDYKGQDMNRDGIGDIPYVIDSNNTDRYPLISPFSTTSNAKTTASISVQPNPAEIGRTVTFSIMVTPPPPTPNDRFDGITLTVIRPDGTTFVRGPFFSDKKGLLNTQYMPDLVGSYSIRVNYPGQFFASLNVTYTSAQSPAITLSVYEQVPRRTWIVDDDLPADFRTIQEAINAASSGDTIFVRSGTYRENPVVNKSLSLIGESTAQTTIIGTSYGKTVTVNASKVTITGFTIQGFGGVPFQPNNVVVCLVNRASFGNNISRNIIAGDGYGIVLAGFNHNVDSNYVTSNGFSGIYTNGSSNNVITRNNVTGGKTGICLAYPSSNNILRNNSMTGDNLNLHVIGYDILSFTNDIDTSNTVNGRPVYYWINKENLVVPSDAAAVYLINCTGIKVDKLHLVSNGQGVLLAFSTGCLVQGNTIRNCDNGIRVQSSSTNNVLVGNDIYGCQAGLAFYQASNNTIRNNTVSSSSNHGVFVFISSGNRFYHNNFTNKKQVWVADNLTNTWDNGYPSGGNHWSDYNGTDADGDGIGDTPYIITGNNTDRYPLAKTYVQSNTTNATSPADSKEGKTLTAQPKETQSKSNEETIPIDEEPASPPNEDGRQPFTQTEYPLSAAIIPIALLLAVAIGISCLGPLYLIRRKR